MTNPFNILNFLEEYQRHPCLWDKSISDYKNRGKRDSVEENLLKLSGMTNIKELRQKIRSLRCTYNQELAKIKGSMRTGTGTMSIYKPKLAWFELADSFLRKNYDDTKETETNLVMNATENTVMTQEESHSLKRLPTNITQNSKNESNETFKAPKRKVSISNKTNKQQKINSSLDNAVEALKFACSQKSATNEFNIFGQLVASQLEKLPLEKSLKLQTEIQSMLIEARLSTISDNSSTSSLLSSSNISEDFEENYDDYITVGHQSPGVEENSPPLFLEEDNEASVSLYYNNWTNWSYTT